MKDQWKEHWNDRYSKDEFIYGKEPNKFFEEEVNKLNPGKILMLGEGEGRNAVYAASLGWIVDAVDQSQTGKAKAMQLSSERKVKINYYVEDLYSFTPKLNYYDAAVFIFLHLEESLRSLVFKKAIDSLKPGGKIIVYNFVIKSTISMAEIAASQPLLPAFVPARSKACSIVSDVITPKITGNPVSKLTFAIPFDTSAAI
mgnify:FL=1